MSKTDLNIKSQLSAQEQSSDKSIAVLKDITDMIKNEDCEGMLSIIKNYFEIVKQNPDINFSLEIERAKPKISSNKNIFFYLDSPVLYRNNTQKVNGICFSITTDLLNDFYDSERTKFLNSKEFGEIFRKVERLSLTSLDRFYFLDSYVFDIGFNFIQATFYTMFFLRKFFSCSAHDAFYTIRMMVESHGYYSFQHYIKYNSHGVLLESKGAGNNGFKNVRKELEEQKKKIEKEEKEAQIAAQIAAQKEENARNIKKALIWLVGIIGVVLLCTKNGLFGFLLLGAFLLLLATHYND